MVEFAFQYGLLSPLRILPGRVSANVILFSFKKEGSLRFSAAYRYAFHGASLSLLVVSLLWGLGHLANPIGVERTPLQTNRFQLVEIDGILNG
jgi:hypothetical protein